MSDKPQRTEADAAADMSLAFIEGQADAWAARITAGGACGRDSARLGVGGGDGCGGEGGLTRHPDETTPDTFDVPATIALLTKAAELDPEAWAAPMPDKFGKRRTASVWRARAELETDNGKP